MVLNRAASFVILCAATFGTGPLTLRAQGRQPKLIDAHMHYDGEPGFLDKLLARLEAVDGVAFLLTTPRAFDGAKAFIDKHPDRLIGFGDIKLDDPQALELVDRFHAAGFRGLGEMSSPLRNYDDKGYWPIYQRAEQYGMIVLFHTGIVNRPDPSIAADISTGKRMVMMMNIFFRTAARYSRFNTASILFIAPPPGSSLPLSR